MIYETEYLTVGTKLFQEITLKENCNEFGSLNPVDNIKSILSMFAS